ncbi:MAG: hypothetical protein NWE95_05035 [Candidatus Bathyarchaeota archaeon]|nr:hypothetical protein [Candidatus Bathyarchaeota archaeon]
MGKVLRSFKFKPELYGNFKKLANTAGYNVTDALERFMSSCIEANALVFPQKATENSEAEARILVDWLEKGKHFYRTENGEEINIQGRLLWLLPKIQDTTLKNKTEHTLKKSVTTQE